MSLLGILNIGRLGLVAQQAGLNAVGNNIANVNTPGYTRQEVLLESDSVRVPGLGGVGTGVSILETRRARDRFADAEVRNELSTLGWWRSQNEELSRVEAVMNDLDGGGLADTLNAFWSGWQGLCDRPEDRLSRETVVEAGRTLARTMNGLANELARVARAVDQAIADKSARVGELGAMVADLNGRVIAQGGQALGLADTRDRLIDELSSIVPVTATPEDSGAVIVRMGAMIVAGRTESLTLTMKPDAEPGTAARGPLWAHDGQPAAVAGGELGGLIEIRDRVLPELRSRLDRLAYGIASEVNRLHREGTDLDGVRGEDFFSLPGGIDELDPAGAASTIALSDAVSGDPARVAAAIDGTTGDNRGALAIAALRTARIDALGGATVDEYWAASAGYLGQRASQASEREAEHQQAADQFESLRQSISGVSLDEEASKLIMYEHAYSAAARVIRVADEMARTLLETL